MQLEIWLAVRRYVSDPYIATTRCALHALVYRRFYIFHHLCRFLLLILLSYVVLTCLFVFLLVNQVANKIAYLCLLIELNSLHDVQLWHIFFNSAGARRQNFCTILLLLLLFADGDLFAKLEADLLSRLNHHIISTLELFEERVQVSGTLCGIDRAFWCIILLQRPGS